MSDLTETLRELDALYANANRKWDVRKTRVYFGDGGIDLRDAPDAEARAALIVALHNAYPALRSQVEALTREKAEEIEEFNAGWKAYKDGVAFNDLPDTKHDVIGSGYAWAAFNDLTQRAQAAEARAEALRKDAERYRWLRENRGKPFERNGLTLESYWDSDPLELDAAIDAALSASKVEPQDK